ncbi:ABC transporter permease [Clostridium isatidis]|uniref:ABC transporter permease n=1 Tax=Clostridium isatidis TaxID=182773 RepID=A0A343JF57_9CLOT|nr:ABC transporter permease [Clostridium isatidis]ASW44165.1 ABC transporter permease [Clostridium isatidis]
MEWITNFLAAAVVAGTPLLFATLGEIITEKAGNLNLGVEGMMLMGAVIGFIVGLKTESAVMALLAAMAAGALGAFIYAFLTVTLKANQNVTGLTLTIFGSGFSSFVGKSVVGQATPDSIKSFFIPIEIPLLSNIPVLGKALFSQDLFIYIGYICTILLTIYLYKTNIGLNLTAVGENPSAAASASINIDLYKYIHILLGGALCGLGGAYLSLVHVPAWQENITAGRGWIAVALVVFTAWRPNKAIIGAFLFGGLDIIRFRITNTLISIYFMDMIPYVVTIAILIFIGIKKSTRNAPPKSLGIPYFREER